MLRILGYLTLAAFISSVFCFLRYGSIDMTDPEVLNGFRAMTTYFLIGVLFMQNSWLQDRLRDLESRKKDPNESPKSTIAM